MFDLGGGTFDVSVLEVGDGVFEVLSTSGDTHLGGDDFDKRIVDWLAEDFQKAEGLDLRKDRQALQVRPCGAEGGGAAGAGMLGLASGLGLLSWWQAAAAVAPKGFWCVPRFSSAPSRICPRPRRSA